jgi:hypothetical protein
MKITLFVACAAIVAIVSLSAGSARAARSSPTMAPIIDCKGLTGAGWKIGANTGTHYLGVAQGVTCAFVKIWVARLEGPPHPVGMLKGGPAGWTCTADRRYYLNCRNAVKVFEISPVH